VVIVGAGIAGSALAAALAPAGLEILLLEAGVLPEACRRLPGRLPKSIRA